MKTIYRLEKDGHGPFMKMTCTDHCFKPSFFKRGDNPSDFIYGCTSPDQLMEFFYSMLFELYEDGYTIKTYKVKNKLIRYHSDIEVAFHKSAVAIV